MSTRSFVMLSFVATCFTFAPRAHADLPPATASATTTTASSTATTTTTGAGGSTSTTTGGAGGAKNDPTCTVAQESIDGTTCKECDPSSSCGSVGSDYNLVCQRTASAQVWCNGPKRNSPSDQNVACAVAVPGGPWPGAVVAGALAVAAGLFLRRRR
jgi:hypothetical protein